MEVCLDNKKQMIMMLKRLDRHVTQVFEKRTEVSLTRYEILVSLVKKGCVTQKVLQQSLAIDQSAITRHLKLLEEQFMNDLYDDFSDSELQQLKQFLTRLNRNVEKL